MCLWWRIRVPPPSDFLCAKQMTTLCSPIHHRLTLCVKTDKAFATPNSVRVVMVIMTGPTFYPVFIYSFYVFCIVEPAALYTLLVGFFLGPVTRFHILTHA